MRALCLGLLWAVSLPCIAVDDFKVIELEQDLIELTRRVEGLSRQIEEIERRGAGAERGPSTGAPRAPAPPCPDANACPPAWLRAANWQRVRVGMSEFDVIDILGPPTSVRGAPEAASRTLMYAMEIGSSAFLSGQVLLTDRRVTGIQTPVLK
jgi:hypothetical protein